MADVGASQRRGLHSGTSRTGQEQSLSRGESNSNVGLPASGTDQPSTCVASHESFYVSPHFTLDPNEFRAGRRGAGTLGATHVGLDSPIGTRGQSYVQRNFGQGAASQGVTDHLSLNSKTPGPDRVLPPPTSSSTVHFKMRARDPNCPGIVYRTWVVTGNPDFSATQYVGVRCGVLPLTEVIVIDLWRA